MPLVIIIYTLKSKRENNFSMASTLKDLYDGRNGNHNSKRRKNNSL